MIIVWAAIGIAALVSSVAWSRYCGSKDLDLGGVSHQWLAEQRQRIRMGSHNGETRPT